MLSSAHLFRCCSNRKETRHYCRLGSLLSRLLVQNSSATGGMRRLFTPCRYDSTLNRYKYPLLIRPANLNKQKRMNTEST